MSQMYDAIVIGAGHNGLTCACYLAKAGLKTLALDQYHTVGGMATTEEITLPGFRSDLHAFGYQFANLSPVPQELKLADFGFELIRPKINCSHVFPITGLSRYTATSRPLLPILQDIPRKMARRGGGSRTTSCERRIRSPRG
jgi:phytoene dehydrogenase-like protein